MVVSVLVGGVPFASSRFFQGLIHVLKDIVDVLESYRKPYELGRDAPFHLLFLVQLRMCGRGRMNGQALCVSHIRKMGEDLQVVDEPCSGLPAALDPEDDHGPEPLVQVPARHLVGRVILQAGIPDPFHEGVFF